MDGDIPNIDVRDMLCAQALAVVSDAVKRRMPGEPVNVEMNSDDVRQDMVLWARRLGHRVEPLSLFILRIERADSPAERA